MTVVRSIVGVVAWFGLVGAAALGVLGLGEWRIAAASSIVGLGIWLTLYGMMQEAPKVGEAK